MTCRSGLRPPASACRSLCFAIVMFEHLSPDRWSCVLCQVSLIEVPFLVVTLDEIEIVSLERVGMSKKSFDMTIVFKVC